MVKNLNKITLNEALQKASFFLNQYGYDANLARHYWMQLYDWDLSQTVNALNQPISQGQASQFEAALFRIVKDEPIQYISGYTYFMDHKYQVSPDCLIPREETAGLVEKALAYMRKLPPGKVIDVGTGSGAIAIELKKALPTWEVYASDFSQSALKMAKKNANNHQVDIQFIHSDLMKAVNPDLRFDVFVSNPPYIAQSELDLMDASVKKYEPQLALFAEDEGLAIYKALAKQLPSCLNPRAGVFFEIGFAQGLAVKTILQDAFPMAFIKIERDFAAKDRYVSLIREGEKN
ncbi:peptide chain release factor N(5)-glutamine methyltransferase [Facklamia sp. 7083-14-GEN3]|uniref:peptide chain release factor N(5)-glutamine methyltransferase n=1 Tax=Facklamia sp. 7083-14-GEN3 TaxID=2973478 RepID=UPI00215C9C25|nr:peptide chain release factor N(5)-glutamine methyltransferase [Facklamia sp. 7083-14-GEN3]MCR8969176.1 peptide chain release factor N(5)-glutamine methyltransferase [Facklamia sp. 7083-14-GEN3]